MDTQSYACSTSPLPDGSSGLGNFTSHSSTGTFEGSPPPNGGVSCKKSCKPLTRSRRCMKSSKKKRTVTTVGHGESEVKIYTLRNRAGYESFQCCWYDLGKRQTKTFGDRDAATLFAQQKTVEVANGIPAVTQATLRDIEVFKSCEKRVSAFGVALPIACEEWATGGQCSFSFKMPVASLGIIGWISPQQPGCARQASVR